MSKSIIKNFIAKMVAGRADDGIMITLSDPRKVDFQTAIMEDLLMRNGIDPRAITSEEQLKMLLNQIDAMNKQSTTTSGIRNAESAKVFDLKGRKIEDTDNIMGGEEMPPPGSRGGKDDIAAPVQSAEGSLRDMTEAEIKANLEAQNKSTIKKILERKNREDVYGLEDYDTTNMSEIKKEIIRTETKLGNLNPNSPDFRERAKPLVDKIEALKNKMRDDKADGGIMRLGLKEGSGMSRRTFLKFLAGAASIPIIGKIFKPLKVGKTVTKVPIIKTDNVPGKPEWFDQLINKVILEGDDVTKQLSTVEREIVHTKKINDTDQVTVYQDLNTDSVRVEYKSPNNMFEDQVNLDYRKTPADEGTPKGSAEFEVTESGIVGRADGPADYSMDVEEVGGQSIKDLDSDVSALKEFATGEKQTLKEFVQSKKRKDKVKRLNEGDPDETSQYVVDRQGDYVPEPDDFASGGIARMLGE